MATFRRCNALALVMSLCALCALVSMPHFASAAIDYDNPTIIGDAHVYTWFTSSNETNVAPREGLSGVGVFCRPGVSLSYDLARDQVAFSDACQTTSTIRLLTKDGYLGVLAGSLASGATTGYTNGPKDVAQFGGSSVGQSGGTALINGIVYQNGNYFLADTFNNAIRQIAEDGTTTTFINTENGYNGEPLTDPTYVANYINNQTNQIIGIFISDTGARRILQVSPPDTTLASRADNLPSQPRVLTSTPNTIYFVGSGVGIFRVRDTQQGAAVLLNNLECVTYYNSLVINDDETALYFLASSTETGKINVYTIPLTGTIDPTACPELVFDWPFTDSLHSMARRSGDSWILMTSSAVYAGGLSPLTPIEDTTTTTTTTTTSSSAPDPDTTTTTTTTEVPSIYTGRTHGIAAFPRDALPTEDPCLMSQLYYWMRVDAEIAYGTTDYYTQFVPLDDESKAYYGDVNVSGLCNQIEARQSNDGTIEIVDFWGPYGYDKLYTQSRLTDSPWTWTRRFLDGLNRDDLGPFCFYNCTDQCLTATASKKMCVGYESCDDICKGAIASSVVMGVTGIVLIVLMIVSPANLFTALVMVPII